MLGSARRREERVFSKGTLDPGVSTVKLGHLLYVISYIDLIWILG